MNVDDNPFRILELSTTASSREIRRRVEELSIKVGLGLAPAGLTEEGLRSARQALEDPAQRVAFELLWLLSPPEIAPPSTDPDDTKLVELLLLRLRQLAYAGDEPGASIANHDIAMLHLARFFSDTYRVEDLRVALAGWAQTFRSELFWNEIDRRVHAHNDPRMVAELTRLRVQIPSIVLDSVVSAVERAHLHDRYLAGVVATIRGATGFPGSAIEVAIRQITEPTRVAAHAAVEELEASLATLTRATDSHAALREAQSILRDKTRSQVGRIRLLDPATNDPSAADSFARQLAQLAAATAYLAEDWLLAISFMTEAVQTAQSQSVVAELAGRQAQLRRDYHVARINEALGRLDWIGVAAHSELAAQYADEVERPEFWAGARAAQHRSPASRMCKSRHGSETLSGH